MIYKYLHSLQARYTFFAVVLGTLVLSTAFLSYLNVSSSQQTTTHNLNIRSEFLESSRQIRISILAAYKSLDLFLLNPERTEYKNSAYQALDSAINYAAALQQQSSRDHQLRPSITILESSISTLKQEVGRLFSTRSDPTLQYPAMMIGNTIMQPSRNHIINAFALVMNELNEENTAQNDNEVFQAFLQANNRWNLMLSNFRLYIANRVGSFNEKALSQQEKSIDTLYQGLKKQLSVLFQLKQDNRLDIQSDAAIDEINAQVDKWYNKGFIKVKAIHNSADWRMDSKLMKEVIAPRISDISFLLQSLEVKIERQAEKDLNLVSDLAHRQNLILWLTIGLWLTYLVIIVITINRMVFRPIRLVSRALKAEAFGNDEDVMLPLVKSEETQDLIDAFSEMKKQVHNRQNALEY